MAAGFVHVAGARLPPNGTQAVGARGAATTAAAADVVAAEFFADPYGSLNSTEHYVHFIVAGSNATVSAIDLLNETLRRYDGPPPRDAGDPFEVHNLTCPCGFAGVVNATCADGAVVSNLADIFARQDSDLS